MGRMRGAARRPVAARRPPAASLAAPPRSALHAPRRLRGLLGLCELALDELEAGVPEAGVGEIDADDPPELLGTFRAAGGEQLEVPRHERGALLLVALVHRQREQLAVGVCVHVAGAADEEWNVGPPRAIALRQLDGVAEQLALALRPQPAQPLDRQLPL